MCRTFFSLILFISYNQYDILFLLFSYHKDTELYLLLCRLKRQVLSFRGSIPNIEKHLAYINHPFIQSTLANPEYYTCAEFRICRSPDGRELTVSRCRADQGKTKPAGRL